VPFRELIDMSKKCLRCGSRFGSEAEYCPHDGTLLSKDQNLPDPLIGKILLEQFRVDEQIGVGGMGTVYRAHQTTVGRPVAIKVLRADLARDEQAVLRFEREARLSTALDHPNLVRVFLSGRLPDGRLYIVMELLEGRSLADELDENGPPSLERAVIMIMKLCAGLGAVHEAGVIHRDIKPENVYLVRRGRDDDFVKLVDFGVARVLDGVGPTTTQSGRVFGTAAYISPEAATGDETDHRSDIYSLGVLSYQMLAGELPFEGSSVASVLMKHVHEPPPLLQARGVGARVPHEVASVIMRALSKGPDERQQTLAEFLDSLAEAAGNAGLLNDARTLLLGTIWGDELAAPGSYLADLLSSSSPSSLPPAFDDTQRLAVDRDPDDDVLFSLAPKPFGTTAFNLAAPAPAKKRSSHPWLWVGLGAVAVALIGVVAGVWFRGQTPRATAAEPISVDAPSSPVADVGTSVPTPSIAPPPADPKASTEAVDAPATSVAASEPEPEPEDALHSQPKSPTKADEEESPRKPPKKSTKRPKARTIREVEPSPPSAPEPEVNPKPVLEPDEGIDWSVPDFPETTAAPEAPPRNPVVIDEPPTR
jgi:serine/threonine-protein kinase